MSGIDFPSHLPIMKTLKSCLKELHKLQLKYYRKREIWIHMSVGADDPYISVTVFSDDNKKIKNYSFYTFNKEEYQTTMENIRNYLENNNK